MNVRQTRTRIVQGPRRCLCCRHWLHGLGCGGALDGSEQASGLAAGSESPSPAGLDCTLPVCCLRLSTLALPTARELARPYPFAIAGGHATWAFNATGGPGGSPIFTLAYTHRCGKIRGGNDGGADGGSLSPTLCIMCCRRLQCLCGHRRTNRRLHLNRALVPCCLAQCVCGLGGELRGVR
jgi:hypothetical protein